MTKKLKEMMDLAMRRISSKTSVLALLMMVSVIPALAQDLVKGTVIDNNGDAVIGATVVQKDDKKNATITDLDGNFTLRLPDGKGTILVSYVGMKEREVKVSADKHNKVTMEEDDSQLEELVEAGKKGLVIAIRKYDRSRGFRFISYAVWYVRNSILQAIEDKSKS